MTISFIINIKSQEDISLPNNAMALLYALDKALEDDTFEIVYQGSHTSLPSLIVQDTDGFSTYILFELEGQQSRLQLIEQIKELASYACSPEIIERSDNYQLVRIDSCPLDFRR